MGSSNASFVTDEVVDRVCLVGEPEQHIARLRTLAEAGVTSFAMEAIPRTTRAQAISRLAFWT